jgi:hypothetical protein
MCHTVMDPASLLGRAPTLSHVPQLQTHFLVEEGFDAATCPVAPDPPPCRGGLWCCHVSYDSLRVAGLKYKGSQHWLSRAFKARTLPRHTRTQVPKAHAPDSATVVGKGHTRLTRATTTSKVGVT